MRLSIEILDHIFSFLVSHRDILIACSTDPFLSQIVRKHLYYHLIVNIGDGSVEKTVPNYGFEQDHLSTLVSADPCILRYVRILEIKFVVVSHGELQDDESVEQHLHGFAATLVKFPTLECIMLKATDRHKWHWPPAFRTALKDRLHLSTLKKVHFDDSWDLLLPLLDNCENIINLSLVGLTLNIKDSISPSTFPQLKSLALIAPIIRSESTVVAWIKLHIKKLQSLKCAMSSMQNISELLGVCSETLHTLDINLVGLHGINSGESGSDRRLKLSPFPPNLRRLIIRTSIVLEDDLDQVPWYSTLLAAAEAINLLVPSPRHLILDISIGFINVFSSLANVDFSPLAVLGAVSIPQIDLYIHTGSLPSALTRAQLLSSLEGYEDVIRSIKQGIVVIHSETTAPDYL